MAPLKAAQLGAGEIGFTILSMTISLAAVFIPLLFMGGIVGRLFHEFSITIVAAILMSGVVALTLTPMLCSRLLKSRMTSEHERATARRAARRLRAHARLSMAHARVDAARARASCS